MFQLSNIRNRPSIVQHPQRHYYASHRHPSPPPLSNILASKDHARLGLRHGRLRHRRRHPDQSLLSGPEADILRLYELVLPRSLRGSVRYQLTYTMATRQRCEQAPWRPVVILSSRPES